MEGNSIQNYIKELLENTPSEWLNLTTHRLDIYDESLAKSQFLAQFEVLFSNKEHRYISASKITNSLRLYSIRASLVLCP